jgi:hypothetical protein
LSIISTIQRKTFEIFLQRNVGNLWRFSALNFAWESLEMETQDLHPKPPKIIKIADIIYWETRMSSEETNGVNVPGPQERNVISPPKILKH